MFEELTFRPQEQLPAQPCRRGEGILTLDRLPTLGVGTVPDTRSFFGYLFPQGLLREHLLWPQDLPALHMPLHKHLYWPQGSTDWTASPRPWLSAGREHLTRVRGCWTRQSGIPTNTCGPEAVNA